MALEAKHIVRFFSRMQHLYAHRWTSVYGAALSDGQLSASAQQWLYDMSEYSPEQVAFGLQRLTDKRLEWPPGPIEFANLCDGIPSVAEVLDRENYHGPVCEAIRKRIDWYNLDALPSAKVPEATKFGLERALVAIKRDGTLPAIIRQHREALAQSQEALA